MNYLTRYSIVLLHALFILPLTSFSQEIQIGKPCPDVEFTQVVNDPGATIRLSDYKGKLIVLDFWSTMCKGCIEAFPKMEALQKKFGDKIQILLINRQSEEVIKKFFSVHKKIKVPDLPMIAGDSTLHKLFPYEGLPFHVWLDEQRVVLAKTNGYGTNEVTLQEYFRNGKIQLVEKKVYKEIDWSLPFLANVDSSLINTARFYSYLFPYHNDIPYDIKRQRVNGSKIFNRVTYSGYSIQGLYEEAYSLPGKVRINDRNTIYEVKDPSALQRPKEEHLIQKWNQKNLYVYDLMVAPQLAEELHRIMQEDLARGFGFSAGIEKRTMKCMALVRTSQKDYLKSKGEKPEIKVRKPPYDSLWILQNMPFSVLASRVEILLKKLSPLPFADATGYSGNIDVAFDADLFDQCDLSALKQVLQKYGLDVVEKVHPIDVLVIRERSADTFKDNKQAKVQGQKL